jgi:murein DD-endopeptidase MepM/ murein hydrolase activator NlpD
MNSANSREKKNKFSLSIDYSFSQMLQSKLFSGLLRFFVLLLTLGSTYPTFAETFSIDGYALNTNGNIRKYDTRPEILMWLLNNNDADQNFDQLSSNFSGAVMLKNRTTKACANSHYGVGSKTNTWDCNPADPDMAWILVKQSDGTVLLQNQRSKLCLQIGAGTTGRSNYGIATMQSCNAGNRDQKWQSTNAIVNPPRGYYPTLGALTNDQWDVYSGDNTRFDPPLWSGEVDECSKTPTEIAQIYTDLTTTIFGQRRRMTAGYLYDASYFNGEGKWHAALDIDAPNGTPVKAVIGGTTWNIQNTFGNYFMAVKGDDGKLWIYGHLGSLNVGNGARIEAGTVVGKTGSLNHLHLEVQNSSTKYEQTLGASSNQQFVRDVTFSPLQAFWQVKNR